MPDRLLFIDTETGGLDPGKMKQRAVSSDKAFTLFDIKVEGRHTALGDAIATAALFSKLLSLLNFCRSND